MRCENCTVLCIKCIDSVDIDSIECIRDPCPVSTVSTYIVMMVWLKSPQSQLSKTFLWIENQLNIKKSYGQKCVDVFCIDSVDIDSIECIACFDLCIDSVDKKHSIHNTQ